MAEQPAVNQTMRTFGYPAATVAEYAHWAVLLRPQQATLGARDRGGAAPQLRL